MDAPDWASLLTVLADRDDAPLAVVDERGIVLVANTAMGRLLALTEGANPIGRAWLAAGELGAASAGWLSRAQLGHATTASTRVRRDGRVVTVQFTFTRVGRPPSLLIRATSVHHEHTPATTLDYEISLAEASFGRIVDAPNAAPCFVQYYGREAPCGDCPARGAGAWPRRVTRRVPKDPALIEVLRAELVAADRARVRRTTFEADILAELIALRLDELANANRLSARERDVLRRLAAGEGTDAIAHALRIRPRTIKFHQANLLRKLGAESRADLLRLLFF